MIIGLMPQRSKKIVQRTHRDFNSDFNDKKPLQRQKITCRRHAQGTPGGKTDDRLASDLALRADRRG
jgi:hypothetical protein